MGFTTFSAAVSLLLFPAISNAAPTVTSLHSFVAAPTPVPVIFDGRVPKNFPLKNFDSSSKSPFNSQNVLGAGQKWSEVIVFPDVEASLFDGDGKKPLEVTLNDKSIFAPGGKPQKGFRRSELIPSTNNGTDATVNGVTTFHFSLRDDVGRPLNMSHEYQLAFIETNDFSSHVWTIKSGSPFSSTPGPLPSANAATLRLESSTAGGAAGDLLFSVPFKTGGDWHNFAIQTDWDKNTITAYYSSGNAALKKVVSTKANDAKGKGQAHVGILKLPVGGSNPSQEGFQPSGINEGVIYGGIFVEASSISLAPACAAAAV